MVLTAVWNERRYTGSVFLICQETEPQGRREDGVRRSKRKSHAGR